MLQATPSQQSKKVLNQFFWNEGNYPLSVDTLDERALVELNRKLSYNLCKESGAYATRLSKREKVSWIDSGEG